MAELMAITYERLDEALVLLGERGLVDRDGIYAWLHEQALEFRLEAPGGELLHEGQPVDEDKLRALNGDRWVDVEILFGCLRYGVPDPPRPSGTEARSGTVGERSAAVSDDGVYGAAYGSMSPQDLLDARKRGLLSVTLMWPVMDGEAVSGAWQWSLPMPVEVLDLFTNLAERGALPAARFQGVKTSKQATH